MKKIHLIVGFLAILSLHGCAGIPKGAFALSETNLELRQLQTRFYQDISEEDILAASAGVLQDLGYIIDESETLLGVVSASKVADATSGAQVAGAIFLALLGGGATPIDDEQHIKLGLVVTPNLSTGGDYTVRITIQRIIYNTQGVVSRSETLENVAIYEEFFEKLSKSVFLEENL